ncbi:IMV membrane protein [NY_014 poxvirus]|uniref:IMV membrane protein n=1 Tax=NY_014 poxvirus TaxID=2025360 RepID=UPI000B9A16AA|nr:IMV membrane protein [NY_014 poxvirus]AST09481.1 IMV membrane protein [NY_014 poxvirus]
MGAAASIQTSVNTLSERISTKLIQEANASAETNCEIEIGSFIIRKNNGCNVTVKNLCSANADAQLEAVLSAATETYSSLTPEQKAYVPAMFTAALNIQTTVNTVVRDFENYIKQTCNSDAVVNNKLKIQNIFIDECTALPGSNTTLEFINTGTSKGNCAIKALMDITTKANTQIAPRQIAGTGVQFYIIAIAVVVLGFLFIYYAKRMLFTSTNDKIKIILANKENVHWTTYMDVFFRNNSPLVMNTDDE